MLIKRNSKEKSELITPSGKNTKCRVQDQNFPKSTRQSEDGTSTFQRVCKPKTIEIWKLYQIVKRSCQWIIDCTISYRFLHLSTRWIWNLFHQRSSTKKFTSINPLNTFSKQPKQTIKNKRMNHPPPYKHQRKSPDTVKANLLKVHRTKRRSYPVIYKTRMRITLILRQL